MHVFRMSLGWQLCLCSIPVLGCVAMMVGIAPSLLVDEAPSEAERWVATIVGAVMLSLGVGVVPHMRCTIDATQLRYFGFGPWATTRSLAFAEVRRWGHAVGRNQGRREPLLLFELRDGSSRTVKLAMYREQARIRERLAERLGPESPARATLTGLRFDD